MSRHIDLLQLLSLRLEAWRHVRQPLALWSDPPLVYPLPQATAAALVLRDANLVSSCSEARGVVLRGELFLRASTDVLVETAQFHPGTGVGLGKDYTLFATQEGIVSFHQTKYKREVRAAFSRGGRTSALTGCSARRHYACMSFSSPSKARPHAFPGKHRLVHSFSTGTWLRFRCK